MKFSIIIPVRKINDFMRENISRLKGLHYNDYEVLVITDELEEYDFGDSRFKIIPAGPKGPGEKRNIGAGLATGGVFSFLDDDAYPAPDWLDEACKIFNDQDVYALGAPALTPLDAGFLERMSGHVLESVLVSYSFVYRHLQCPRKFVNDYPTVNLFVRKEAFFAVGGFPVEFWPGEDTKFCLDLVKRFGRKFLYDPKPVVYHHRRNLFSPHLKQISRYGRHRGQFARIFPETSRLPVYFIPSFFVFGLLGGLSTLFFSRVLFSFYSAIVWFYLFLVTYESLVISLREKDKRVSAFTYAFPGIVLTHIVYGVCFIYGFVKRPALKLKKHDVRTGNYIEG